MDCPLCFANAGAGFNLSLEEVEDIPDRFVETEGNPEFVQFSGGEPTIHPQLPAMLRAAKDRGIPHVMINTNGRRISTDDEFLAEIAEIRPSICFQFDGFEDATYLAIRGETGLFPENLRALDRLICECAFCTFPSKGAAALEFRRVLRPGGLVGLTDITRMGVLPPELQTLLGWVACLADARPVDEYIGFLSSVGSLDFEHEAHDGALSGLASKVRFKLIGVEVLARVGKAPVPLDEVLQAKRITKVAIESIRAGTLGYALLVARLGEGNSCTTC